MFIWRANHSKFDSYMKHTPSCARCKLFMRFVFIDFAIENFQICGVCWFGIFIVLQKWVRSFELKSLSLSCFLNKKNSNRIFSIENSWKKWWKTSSNEFLWTLKKDRNRFDWNSWCCQLMDKSVNVDVDIDFSRFNVSHLMILLFSN